MSTIESPLTGPMCYVLGKIAEGATGPLWFPRGQERLILSGLYNRGLIDHSWAGRVDQPSPGRWELTSAGREAAA